MTQPANDRSPLKTIEQSGNFRLKMIAPKFEKVKTWEDGTVSARIFFVDVEGNCLSKNYSAKYGKALAMLVGKFSGKYTAELRLDATPAEFLEYLKPAAGQTIDVAVTVEPNGEWQGKPQFKYKLGFAKGSIKAAPAPDLSQEAAPF
jgi:hypothetical protein